jgi:hypothetical protein
MGIADELQKLEQLHRRGSLSDEEFAKAKTALLADPSGPADRELGEHLSAQLADVRSEQELARIDREWELERQQYLVADRYGLRRVPTTGMGIGVAVVGGVFGALWTVMATAITSAAPDFGPFSIAKVVFPLLGVVFIVAAVGMGVYVHSRALKYEEAFRAYRARRTTLGPPTVREAHQIN